MHTFDDLTKIHRDLFVISVPPLPEPARPRPERPLPTTVSGMRCCGDSRAKK